MAWVEAHEDGLVDRITSGVWKGDTHDSGDKSDGRCACMYASRIDEVVGEEVGSG